MINIGTSQSNPWPNNKQPSFCHGINCPYFTIEKSTEDYEIRNYPSSLWTSTDIQNINLDDAVSTGFRRLFQYIDGNNKQNIKVDMTSPVLTKIVPGAGPNCESNFTVSFYVPYKYQGSLEPPKPASSYVYTDHHSSIRVAVSHYGGYSDQTKVIQH